MRALMICLILATVVAPVLGPLQLAVAQPTQVSYQGVLIRDGVPFNGETRMKFAIVSDGQSLWSIDGTSVSGSEPDASVLMTIQEGIFNVELGGAIPSQPPLMKPLSASALIGSVNPVLRVWVMNAMGVFELIGDHPFSSVPFALTSDAAIRSLGDFSVAGDILGGGNLQVQNEVHAASYFGDGSALTGVQSSGLAAGIYANAVQFTNPANVFVGDGSSLTGVQSSGLAAGIYDNTVEFTSPGNIFTGDGSGLTGVQTSDLAAGTYDNAVEFSNPGNVFTGDGSGLTGLSTWGLTGNAGTDPDLGQYLGTSDAQAFEIRVNGQRALRVEPSTSTDQPNLIGGSFYNSVDPAVTGVVIAGGGAIGNENIVEHSFGTIGGGAHNAITGSSGGTSDDYVTIGGGRDNRAHGEGATIPGGSGNRAYGDYSFAAGRRAEAYGNGSIVLSDGTDESFVSITDNEFAVRATGGVRIATQIGIGGEPTAGVSLSPGDGSWASLSDVNSKENFEPLAGEEVLKRLRDVPVSGWNYKTQSPSIRHAGPMAQDFWRSFGLGDDERRIHAMDLAGIDLAAIQALDARTRDLLQAREDLKELHRELAQLKGENAALTSRLERLERLLLHK
jgi:hypothetical protein